MTNSHSLTPLSDDDYESIAAAVMETGRGRWFLAEYARRNRHSDTEMLLGAIQKLENAVGGDRQALHVDRVRSDLMEMATTIAQLKIELASDNPDLNSFEQATEALDAVVQTTEHATSSILEAAENIQEMAWTLREAGADAATCDVLDLRAADIYTACSFQDLTAQRTKKVVRTLRSIEGRINALVDMWTCGDKPKAGFSGTGQEQTFIDGGDSHSRAPLRIGHPLLSHADIELVMRENETLLIEGESTTSENAPAPSTVAGRTEPEAEKPQDVTPEGAKAMMSEPGTQNHVEAGRHASSNAGHLTLSEIDALPTSRKIELFS